MSHPAVTGAAEPDQAFLECLPLIDRIVAAIVRRHALVASDAEEFRSWLRAKIVESDYAAFRKFAGRSSLTTYLTVVVSNLFRDYRNEQWGRWRPSAEALRRGPVAVRLESLIYRDGLSVRDAVQVLLSSGLSLRDSELTRLAALLPQRRTVTEVGLDEIDSSPRSPVIAPATITTEEQETVRAVEAVLHSLVDSLSPEDATLLRMRFWDDISIADIARTLHLEQKPLYRRLERIQATLRAELEARGVDRMAAAEILSGEFS